MNGDVFCSAPGDGMSVADSKGIAVGLNVCSRHAINMGPWGLTISTVANQVSVNQAALVIDEVVAAMWIETDECASNHTCYSQLPRWWWTWLL